LVVIFGRGPVPWFHTHDGLGDDPRTQEALARHVERFHSPADHDEHGWHIHWTLPWQILICPCQHDTAPAEERASALEVPQDVAQSAPIHEAERDLHGGAPPILLPAAGRYMPPRWGPLTSSGLNSLETSLPTVSLRALYCVAQC
jgi:hypothetical protein